MHLLFTCIFFSLYFQIIFSSLYEIVIGFTREFDIVRQALASLEEYDKTNLKAGLLGVSQLILEEWGNGTPCQVSKIL